MTEQDIKDYLMQHPQYDQSHDQFMKRWEVTIAKNFLLNKTCVNCRWWSKVAPYTVFCKIFKIWQNKHDSCIEYSSEN